jgi:hypothetical protein
MSCYTNICRKFSFGNNRTIESYEPPASSIGQGIVCGPL